MHVPILLRRDEWQMRLHKAHTEEKWLPGCFERRETFHSFHRHCAIGQLLIAFRTHFIGRTFFGRFAAFALLAAFHWVCIFGHAIKLRHRVLGPVLLVHLDHVAAREPAWFGPRRAIFKAMVLDLAERGGVVAVGAKMLWQGHAVRLGIAEVRVEVPYLRGVRA